MRLKNQRFDSHKFCSYYHFGLALFPEKDIHKKCYLLRFLKFFMLSIGNAFQNEMIKRSGSFKSESTSQVIINCG